MTQQDYLSALSPHLFWDIDKNRADMDSCPSQIIQRVLEYGTLDDWKLILSYYGLDCCISNTDKTQYRCYHTTQSNPARWNF